MNEIASIDKISRTYSQGGKKIEVLHRLSLKVKKGETVAILGQSGSENRPFVPAACLDKPDFGSIEIDGTELTKLIRRSCPFSLQNLGIVFQQYHLMSNLTALERSHFLELQRQKRQNQKPEKHWNRLGYLIVSRIYHLSSPEENATSCLARAMVSKPA